MDKFKESIAGANAGIIGTVLGFPFDTIKTRMQTTNFAMSHAFKEIYRDSGFPGFYRGVGSPLLALTILNTLNFSSYSYFCILLGVDNNISKSNNFDIRISLAAACVGPLASMISTPFELLKTQLQLNRNGNGSNKTNSSIQLASYIIRTKGILSLYIGHRVNTIREVIFLSTYFTVYEHLKHFCNNLTFLKIPKVVSIALAGGFSGSIGWFISFPFDLVKSNIQGRDILHSMNKYSDISIAMELLKSRGLRGLYSGILPSILRAFIVSSSRFSAYEGTLYLLAK